MSEATREVTKKTRKQQFRANEYVVYPAHGVGRITSIEQREVEGVPLELFVIAFDRERMTLRVPVAKVASSGMRALADRTTIDRALQILQGRARVKRTMWARRAQEYEQKIHSGDLISIAEVVRDLHRTDSQPEQSYSERQLYEEAMSRLTRELAAAQRIDEKAAANQLASVLTSRVAAA